MNRKKLLATPETETPDTSHNSVVGVAQIVDIDEEQVLNVDLYYSGELKGRHFVDRTKENYITYVLGRWETCCLANVERLIMGLGKISGGYELFTNIVLCNESKRIIEGYLGIAIEWWESDIRRTKKRQALDRKIDRLNNLMNQVLPVTGEMEAWIQTQIFPEEYLFYRKEKNQYRYGCTGCGAESWRKERFVHNQNVVCPKCGREVVAKGRVKQVTRRENVVLLQEFVDNQWIERQFTAECHWEETSKILRLYEDVRAVIPKNGTWGKVYYGQIKEADEFEQEWWTSNPINKRFKESYLFPENVRELLAGGPLEHSGLDILASRKKKINVDFYIVGYEKYPHMEYLVKGGFYHLVADIVRPCWWWNSSVSIQQGTNAKTVLKLDGNRVHRLRQINGGENTLKWLRYEQSKGIHIQQESLEWLDKSGLSPDDAQELLFSIKSVNRMVNYLKKQKYAPKEAVIKWHDYLQMARQEGMDITDDIVKFPKDLRLRHDQLVELRNERLDQERVRKNEEKYRDFNTGIQAQDYSCYCQQIDYKTQGYIIRPASSCEEIIKEGRSLHHCVGASDTYMQKMAAGTTAILFLRMKDTPEKSYYTIEIRVKDNQILQWYSAYDRKPEQAVISKVLQIFLQRLSKPKSKTA